MLKTMEPIAQRLRFVALGALLASGCGPQVSDSDDGQWVVGAWYRDMECEEYPCRGFSAGLEIASAEFQEIGAVETATVALCVDRPPSEGSWEVNGPSNVRIEPVESDSFRWGGGRKIDWVEVTELDECRFQSEDSWGDVVIWRRGVVAIDPTLPSCEGKVVAADSQADACVGRP